MVKYRTHITFVIIMSAYFLVRYLRSTSPELPVFIRFHLTDLLFVPAMCLFALIVLRFLRRDSSLMIHWLAVAIQVVLVSLYFEWYLPNNSPEGHLHVADVIDCVMYAIGGILFLLFQPLLIVENSFKKHGQKKTEPDKRIPKCKGKNV